MVINTLRPIQIGRHSADDTFKCIWNERKVLTFDSNFTVYSLGSIDNIWTNDDQVHWRIYASPGIKELINTYWTTFSEGLSNCGYFHFILWGLSKMGEILRRVYSNEFYSTKLSGVVWWFQAMNWHQTSSKSSFEPMMTRCTDAYNHF